VGKGLLWDGFVEQLTSF